MTLLVHPDILYAAESASEQPQSVFANDPANIQTRMMEDKPALLVVTDATGAILLSVVGQTKWHSTDVKLAGEPYEINLTYRSEYTDAETSFSPLALVPRLPALTFTPASKFVEEIRNTGTATRAFLIVDTLEQYSPVSVEGEFDANGVETRAPWPVGYWDGSVALDVATLPAELPYLELSVGDLNSGASIKITRVDLLLEEGTVQMADPVVYLYLPNILHDWSTARDELIALLTAIPEIGTDSADIQAKEAVAYV